jgi:hypothetical protein
MALREGDNLTVYSVDEENGEAILVDDDGNRYMLATDECEALRVEQLTAACNIALDNLKGLYSSDHLVIRSLRAAIE